MGLTIHYEFRLNTLLLKDVRKVLKELREHALTLPFKEVSEIVEFTDDECDHDFHGDNGNKYRWLKVQSQQYVTEGSVSHDILPKHIIAFSTWPGEGCEEANFGLCLYPETIERKERKITTNIGRGFYWKSFCKTQYASSSDCGGMRNFLRSHLAIIGLLDHADAIGILDSVTDEGGYWEKRDLKALGNEIGAWNEFIAGFGGRLKDTLSKNGKGLTIESEIAKYANFEHLEAKFTQKNPELSDNMGKTVQHIAMLLNEELK